MSQFLFFRLGIRYIIRRWLQSILFIVGVALGVALVIAIDIANDSASRAFSLSAETISGRATHQIEGGPTGIDSALYEKLRVELGLKNSAPVISSYVSSPQLGSQPLRLLGVDPFADSPFRAYLNDIETPNADIDTFSALVQFIVQPDSIIISETLAQRWGLAVGDQIRLDAGLQSSEVTLIGILRAKEGINEEALDDLILADIATAQEITGKIGRITGIDLILNDASQVAAIEAILPPGLTLQDKAQQSGALAQMIDAFEINLQALSLLAVVVGLFLIYNTVTFSVIQRRPVIGILRALGTTRQQVFSFILIEAFVLGLLGTFLGMGLGIILGRLMVGLVAQTISDLYFSIQVTHIEVAAFTLIKAASIGMLASIGTALIPSWDATRTPPAGTMQRSQFEESTRRFLPLTLLAAIFFMILGWLSLQIPSQDLYLSFGALFFIILGGAFTAPVVLSLSMRFFAALLGPAIGVLGRMAPRSIVRSMSRTSVAVAALTIAVSVIVGVSLMIGSFRITVADWLDSSLGADIFIAPPQLTANTPTLDVDASILDLLNQVEGVESISSARVVLVLAPDYPNLPPVNLNAVDFDIAGDQQRFVWSDVPAGAQEQSLAAGKIMVSEPFAFRRGITEENRYLTLQTDQGPETFEVFGVYYDYSTDQGTVLMGRSTYDKFYDDPYITSIALFVKEGVPVQQVLDQLKTETLLGYQLNIDDNQGLKNSVFEVFDRTFTITIALRLLATIVAFIGILSALLSLQLEHKREYGVMRANGMTPGQLWQYTFLQTGLMGFVSGLLALPIGVALAAVLIQVINVRSFGWSMNLSISSQDLLTAFGVAMVAALLAGLYPGWRLSRIAVAEALRNE